MSETTAKARREVEGDVPSRILDQLLSRVGGEARVGAVFGDPVERGGVTVIPIARVRWGVGAGGGEGPKGGGSGGGGGGCVVADPVGWLEITAEGSTFRRIGRPFGGPLSLVAVAAAFAIVVRALGRVRR